VKEPTVILVDRSLPEHAIIVLDARHIDEEQFGHLVVPLARVGGGTSDAVAGSWEAIYKRDGSEPGVGEALSAVLGRVRGMGDITRNAFGVSGTGSGVTGWVLARFAQGWMLGRLTVLGPREVRTPTVDLAKVL
jgi:hypothetical protein